MDSPKKESLFALYFIRLLVKSGVAQELGPEVCWLLTTIVNQEDEIWYSRPVTFYNAPLMMECGFGSTDRLNRARKKAVEAGWLDYVPGDKSRGGTYSTKIPEEHHAMWFSIAKQKGKPTANRRQSAGKPTASADHSAPDLKPNPSPPPQSVSEESDHKDSQVPDLANTVSQSWNPVTAAPVVVNAADINDDVMRLAKRLRSGFDTADCELLWIIAAALHEGMIEEHVAYDAIEAAAKCAKNRRKQIGYIRTCLTNHGVDVARLQRSIVVSPPRKSLPASPRAAPRLATRTNYRQDSDAIARHNLAKKLSRMA